jgi:hypothetical protein
MNTNGRAVLGLVVFLVVGLGPACGNTTTSSATSSSSGSASSSSASPANSNLDPAVAMPNGFPSDFPMYPAARLTLANHVTSNGQTTWGMEWETVDNLAPVQNFYMSKLNQGDWTLSFGGASNGGYSAIFTRKSNSKDAGLLTVEPESGVTHIRLGFGSSS